MLDRSTPVILTYNEAANIRRTFGAVSWARDIVLVDSFSDDATLTIRRSLKYTYFSVNSIAIKPALTVTKLGSSIACTASRFADQLIHPSVTVLYRRERVTYQQDGHTQRVVIDGEVRELRSPILHDARKPLAQWLKSQERYMRLDVGHLVESESARLGLSDRFRKTRLLFPFVIFFYYLFTLPIARWMTSGLEQEVG
jgi:hypothetical protein